MDHKPSPSGSRLVGGKANTGVRNPVRSPLAVGVLTLTATACHRTGSARDEHHGVGGGAAAQSLRLAGTVEATRAQSVLVPRLAGQTAPTLVITRLIRAGARVEPGDSIVEFDPQEQMRTATDTARRARRSRRPDPEEAIGARRSRAPTTRPSWPRRSATSIAPRLDVRKNDLLAQSRSREEHAGARAGQRAPRAAQGDVPAEAPRERKRSCESSRSSASAPNARSNYAEGNAVADVGQGAVRRPRRPEAGVEGQLPGAKSRRARKCGPAPPILDIVDSAGDAGARARQPGGRRHGLRRARPAKIRLDAYPELLLRREGRAVAPLGVASSLTPKVRTFIALVSIQGWIRN